MTIKKLAVSMGLVQNADRAMATRMRLSFQVALSMIKWSDATVMESIAPLEKPEAKQARERAAFAVRKVYADTLSRPCFY